MKYRFRTIIRAPGFVISVVLTLTLGLTSSTTLFAVVYSVLLRPLPYKDSNRLVTAAGVMLAADFRDVQAQNNVFEAMALYEPGGHTLSRGGEAEHVASVAVSPEFLPLLGVAPFLGRGFEPTDHRPGGQPVVLLSHRLWVERFGSNRNILGQSILLDSKPYTIVGVLPPQFHFKDRWFYEEIEVWLPLTLTPSQLQQRGASEWTSSGPAPDAYSTEMLARLKQGVTLERAQQNFESIIARLISEYPSDKRLRGLQLYSLRYIQTGPIGSTLWPLFGGAALLLLVACVNVSILMLARGLSRQHEMAIRTALGARRAQITGYFLEESLLVSALGVVLALPFSVVALRVFKAFAPPSYAPRFQYVKVDGWALLFAFVAALLAAICCGLFASVVCSRSDLNSNLKSGADSRLSLPTSGRSNPQKCVLATQIGAAMILLIGASLMGRSLWLTVNEKLGFDPHNAMVISLLQVRDLQNTQTWNAVHSRTCSEELLRSVKTLPIVQSAAIGDLDFSSFAQMPFAPGVRLQTPMEDMSTAYWWNVSPEFFKTMRIPLLQGRYFTDDDGLKTQSVVVVNQTLAHTYFNGDALGKHLTHPDPLLISKNLDADIVGVVGDTKMAGLTWPVGPEIYTCIWQNIGGESNLILRSNAPGALIAALRQKIDQTNGDFALASVKPVEQAISESSVARPRFLTFLLVTFAALALILTVVGLFGTVAFSVARRTREIGIRVALGAQKRDILRTILFDSTVISVTGIVVGTLVALALTRLIRSWLYGVAPDDAVTFVLSAAALFAVCMFASYIPSRRALRVDPAIVLRDE